MITLKNINKIYGEDGNAQTVIDDLTFEIKQGDMISIMGPSGSGKSTFLNIIGLLDNNYGGNYIFEEVDCRSMTNKERAYMRNTKIGFVFQSFHLIRDLSALENVKMGMVIANSKRKIREKISKKKMNQKAVELLKTLGLEDVMEKKASKLSGGQQQRVAIARALINDPDFILSDEPTGALDQKTGKEIMDILKNLNQKGKTILIVTHDQNVARYCKINKNMLDGRLV